MEKYLFKLLIFAALASSPLFATTYDFVLTGRITDEVGKPIEGPIAMKVSFYHGVSGGTAVLSVASGLESVALQEGVFHIRLSLDAADYQTVFPSVDQDTYFEVTDLTHAPNSPYERSQVTMLPYAAKIPIDDKIFDYDANGKLSFSSAPENGKYLKGNADGSVSWDSPGSAGSAETYTNKIINADNNTITNISNSSIKAGAAIADSKLATISTAGKVSGDAITSGTVAGSTAVSTTGTIATTGKMGVGAAAGTSQLEVKGAGATSATSSLNVMDSAGTSKLYVQDDGKVGIGTTSPSGHLHLSIASSPANSILESTTGNVRFDLKTADTNYFSLQRTNASNDLRFQYNGASVMTLLSSGNLGLGLTSPVEKLDVTGGARIGLAPATLLTVSGSHTASVTTITASAATSGYPSTGTLLIGSEAITYTGTSGSTFTGCTRAALGTTAAAYVGGEKINNYMLTVAASSTLPKMVVTGSGNVGVGATSFGTNAALMHIKSGGGTTLGSNALLRLDGGDSQVGALSQIGFGWHDATWNPLPSSVIGSITTDNSNNTKSALVFATRNVVTNTAPTERMRIDAAGNVGIGTTSPSSKLHLSDGNAPALAMIPSSPALISSKQAANNDFYLITAGVSAASNNGVFGSVTSRGTLGSPTAVASGDALMRLIAAGYDGTAAQYAGRIHFEVDGAVSSGNVPTAISFRTGASSAAQTEAMRVASSGNIGIGTSSPSYKLTVNGEPAANGYTAFTNYSDRRLKKNIKSLEDGFLKKIVSLKPATFYYNKLSGYDEKTRARKISGFIAQELQEVYPEMVHKTKINGTDYLDTNLSSLQVYLVKAIQELKTLMDKMFGEQEKSSLVQAERIAELTERVDIQAAEVAQLQNENQILRSYLCSKDPDAPFCKE